MASISDSDFTRKELDSIYNIDINHPQCENVEKTKGSHLDLEVDTSTQMR